MEWPRLLAYITGRVDNELLVRNEYLAAENRILRARINEFVILHKFCTRQNCADGSGASGLVQGNDGGFYGTTQFGGQSGPGYCTDGCGVIFKVASNGTFTRIYSLVSVSPTPFQFSKEMAN